MPEVEIIRKEIFVVDSSKLDEYGNLIVTDKEGNTHRVNKNHQALHPIFQSDIAIEVGYGIFMKKEFIHTAQQVKDVAPPPQPSDKVLPQHEKIIEKAKAEVRPEPSGQEVGMTTKEVGDMIRAKYLIPVFGKEAAQELIKWYRARILGTTRIEFDGAKLPQFKDKEA